ncbi:MAG: hypothetical protein ACI8ZX_000171 [Planctomycetota bacterium]|jgi:hypothetical protein
MQLLEDKHIIDSGDMAERIAVLRDKVQELLENHTNSAPTSANSKYNDELVEENMMLKTKLLQKAAGIDSTVHDKIVEENLLLKALSIENKDDNSSEILKNIEEENASLKVEIEELNSSRNISSNDELEQENIMLKKQLANREKTIKELDFKLEMFKLAKSLREGAGISTKSEELKKIITEYIKEIDKSIASLNIE